MIDYFELCIENDTGHMYSKQIYTDSRDWLNTALSQILSIQLSWPSSLTLLLLTPPEVSSDSWDRAGPTLVLSSSLLLVVSECQIWSLGRFQAFRVAIQRIRAPKTTRRIPRMLTKMASGGESLYFGSSLNYNKEKLYTDTVTPCIWCGEISFLNCHKYWFLFWHLQAKNEFLSNAHECYSYHTGENEQTAVDMEGHECSSPGYRCNWDQVQPGSKNKLLSKRDKVNTAMFKMLN